MDGYMFEAKQILNKAKNTIQGTISFDYEEKTIIVINRGRERKLWNL